MNNIPQRNKALNKIPPEINIQGFPENLTDVELALWRSRYDKLTRDFLRETGVKEISINLTTSSIPADDEEDKGSTTGLLEQRRKNNNDEATKEERAEQYKSRLPLFRFDFLVLPETVKEDILLAVNLIKLENKIFDEWNLRKIEPFPRTALNFHGEPGTGKTLAAHAVAHQIEKPILVASYAQIESKFHGDGPKNVEAIFYAAERDKSVLFIDEADSLLSKRLTNVTQGSEQAINSMRSQLFICLEQFKGIVIFATNLVSNYDKAFETRVRNIYFPLPDKENRLAIWKQHLFFEGGPPLAKDISIPTLAEIDSVCGRDIKNAVIDAALRVAQSNKSIITMEDLTDAISRIKTARAHSIDKTTLTNELKDKSS